jgi:hypothetical protein
LDSIEVTLIHHRDRALYENKIRLLNFDHCGGERCGALRV